MKINIYYGGRGIIDDPSLYVINKMQLVLEELNIKTERINLYENRSSIATLPATINDCDGMILATTVEWYGMGGYLMQFLDACWLYGNKEKISKTYMYPVVMSTTSGERQVMAELMSAWEILGGMPISGICGYVSDAMTFEMNQDYAALIEKGVENLYRTVSQKTKTFPSSNQAISKIAIQRASSLSLSPQETEQLSRYAADDNYVQTQKKDISELAEHFKGMLDARAVDENSIYIADFERHFDPRVAIGVICKFVIKERKQPLIVQIRNKDINCYYGDVANADIICKLNTEVMNRIISGNESFQRAFMSGDMQVQGDMKVYRQLDQIFNF